MTVNLDFTAGHAILDKEAGAQPAIPDQNDSWGNINEVVRTLAEPDEATQVAGLGSMIGIFAKGVIKTATGAISDASTAVNKDAAATFAAKAKAKTISAPGMAVDPESPAKAAAVVQKELTVPKAPPPEGKYVEAGSLNVERHAPAAAAESFVDIAARNENDPGKMIDEAVTAGRVGELFDSIAKEFELEQPTVTFDERRARLEAHPFKALSAHLSGETPGLMGADAQLAARDILATIGTQTDIVLQQIADGDTSTETLAKALKLAEQTAVIQAMVTRNASELGRALGSQKQIAMTLSGNSLEALKGVMDDGVMSADTLIMSAKAYAWKKAHGKDPAAALASVLKVPTWTEAAVELFKANNLTAIGTHVANIGASLAFNIYRSHLTMPVAAGIGAVRSAFTGSTDRVYASEAVHGIAASYSGVIDGFFNAGKILRGEVGAFEKMSSGQGIGAKYDVTGHALPQKMKGAGEWVASKTGGDPEVYGKAGEKLSGAMLYTFKLLHAGDEAIKVMAYRSELAGLAARTAEEQGLKGQAFVDLMQKITTDPTGIYEPLHKQAIKVATEQALQDKTLGGGVVGQLAKHINGLQHEFPLIGVIAPYVTTPANIPIAVLENSPFAPLTARWRQQFSAGGAERDIAIAKFTVGSSFMAWANMMHENGLITGGGPENPEQRAALMATGWRPWSVVIGENTVTLNRLQPVVGAVLAMASALDKAKYAKEEQDVTSIMLNAVVGVGEALFDSSMMQSVAKFYDITQHGKPAAATFFGNVLENMFIPYSAFLASTARAYESATGSAERRGTPNPRPGFAGEGTLSDMVALAWSTAKLRIPGQRGSSLPKRYWDGSLVMPPMGVIATMISPVTVTPIKKDPETVALVHNGVGVQIPSPMFSIAGVTINLLDLDKGAGYIYDDYTKAVGAARKETVAAVINTDEYVTAKGMGPNSDRALVLTKAIVQGGASGKAQFLGKLIEAVEQNPEAFIPFVQSIGMDIEGFVTAARMGEIESKTGARFTAKGTRDEGRIGIPGERTKPATVKPQPTARVPGF